MNSSIRSEKSLVTVAVWSTPDGVPKYLWAANVRHRHVSVAVMLVGATLTTIALFASLPIVWALVPVTVAAFVGAYLQQTGGSGYYRAQPDDVLREFLGRSAPDLDG